MNNRDLFRFLFESSQVDADTEATLREAEEASELKTRKTPLIKALKSIGIDGAEMQVDEVGAWLILPDAEAWHDAVKKLGSVEAMNVLAEEGWVCEFAGDVADTTEPPEYTINFLCIHTVEPSEQDKATPVDKLNKEVQSGSDTIIPKDQKARDKERAHGVKENQEEDHFGGAAEDALDNFTGYLKNCTDSQIQGVYNKEKKAGRRSEIRLTKAEAERRGITLDESKVNEADSILEDTESSVLPDESRQALLTSAKEINTPEDVKRFFTALITGGINFHPDTPFEDYTTKSGERSFTDEETAVLNAAMQKSFNVPGVDPYETGLKIFRSEIDPTIGGEDEIQTESRKIIEDETDQEFHTKQGAGIKTQWKTCFNDMSSCDGAKHLGPLEFQDNKGEWHDFEVMETPDKLVFGGAVNAGFLESGFLQKEEGESTDEALQELQSDLEVYYNDGPNYVSRIVVNQRM